MPWRVLSNAVASAPTRASHPFCGPLFAAATAPFMVAPALVALASPSLYRRHREAVIMAAKLGAAVCFPSFRLSWCELLFAHAAPAILLPCVGGEGAMGEVG